MAPLSELPNCHIVGYGVGTDQQTPDLSYQKKKRAGCQSVIYLAAVLPGFADFPIQRLPDLTPAA
jgi:hypothetical protein